MEPLKIQIEIGASEALLNALAGIAGAFVASRVLGTKTGAEAPKTEPAIKPAAQMAAAVETPAPEPARPQPTQDELFAAVAETKKTVDKDAIKDLFGRFGIKYSRECPAERRAELIDELIKLSGNA